MRTLLAVFFFVGALPAANAFTCEAGLTKAQELIELAETKGSPIRGLLVKYECEKRGAKELIMRTADLCEVSAYEAGVNLNKALAYCLRMEKYTEEQLRNIP